MARAALLSLALGAACAGVTEAQDPLEPGRDSDVGLPVLSLLWERTLHDTSWSQNPQEFAEAAVDRQIRGDFVYVGSHDGELYCLEGKSGKVVWRAPTGSIAARPLVHRGRVYVGTDDGQMLSLDTYDGEIKWRHATKGAILHAPVLVGDTLVFANDVDHVYALAADDGKWRWQYERETPEEYTVRGHGGVIAGGDRVYAGFSDGHVVALSAQSGEVVWVRSLAGEATRFLDVNTTPVLEGGTLYAASHSGGLYALDASDGAERWRQPILGVQDLAVDAERIYVGAAESGLYALDRGGHVIWRQGIAQGGDPAQPIVSGDYLFVSLADAGLHVVDKRNGRLLQYFDPGRGVSAAPTVQDDHLYVLSNGGVLYAMSIGSFRERR